MSNDKVYNFDIRWVYNRMNCFLLDKKKLLLNYNTRKRAKKKLA